MMKIEKPIPPQHMETILIKIIIVDFIATFLILGIIFNALAIYYRLAPFPQVLLLVPAISILCAIISIARFYRYISTVIRVSGALTKLYKEFDGGEAITSVDVPQPFLIFRHFLKKYTEPSSTRIYMFAMDSTSEKYKLHAGCSVDKDRFLMSVNVIDWHGLKHERTINGPIARIQPMMGPVIHDIRREVLEARGIHVTKPEEKYEYYVPAVEKPKPIEEIKPKVSLREMVEEIEAEKPKPLQEIDRTLLEIKQMAFTEKKVAEQKETIRKTLEQPEKISKRDKEALQDVLFQLEEIEKILKER